METGVLPRIDTVVAVWVELRLKLFVGAHQGCHHVVGILWVNIVIGHTANNQQLAFQLCCMVNRRIVFITGVVFLRGSHIPEVYKLTKYYTRSCQKLGSISCALNLHNTHINNILEGGLSQEANELMTSVRDTIASTRKQLIKDLIKSAQGPIFTRLQTIPGVGPYIAASVIGEIQNMERFKTAHTLTAYVGLDPKIRQSGKALNSTGRLTKRGSSYLRRSIFIAASVARQYDPNMKALYNKKRNEGKGYKVATIVVARKLLTIIRAVWLSEQDYDPLFVDIKNRHES